VPWESSYFALLLFRFEILWKGIIVSRDNIISQRRDNKDLRCETNVENRKEGMDMFLHGLDRSL
jgi:hypothetical protein